MSDLQDSPSAGSLIRSAREMLVPKLSIRAAAARIDLSPEQWGNIERGYRYAKDGETPRVFDPPASTIAKMARVVGVTPEQLTDAGRPDAAASLEEFLRQKDAQPLAAVPDDPEDDAVFDLVARMLEGDLEEKIWAVETVSRKDRLAVILALREKQAVLHAELAAELAAEEGNHGAGLTAAST